MADFVHSDLVQGATRAGASSSVWNKNSFEAKTLRVTFESAAESGACNWTQKLTWRLVKDGEAACADQDQNRSFE